MTALLVLLSVAWATCDAPDRFDFVGQPDCVTLRYDGARTWLQNDCEHALLVDDSVTLGHAPVIPAQAKAALRDLNTFTLGMDGALYRVVAVWDDQACAAPPPAAKPAPAPVSSPVSPIARWFEGAVGFVVSVWAG